LEYILATDEPGTLFFYAGKRSIEKSGYEPYPNYEPGCAWRRVWNGYAWVRACI